VNPGAAPDPSAKDLHMFTHENLLQQLAEAPFGLGAYTVRFYAENGKPVNRVTPVLSDFYLYPSGGTLRDSAFNLVFYDSRYDTYRGFKPPHPKKP
jgi:hypothetical protein